MKKEVNKNVLPLREPLSICAPMNESACRPIQRRAFSHHLYGYFCSLARAWLIKSA